MNAIPTSNTKRLKVHETKLNKICGKKTHLSVSYKQFHSYNHPQFTLISTLYTNCTHHCS